MRYLKGLSHTNNMSLLLRLTTGKVIAALLKTWDSKLLEEIIPMLTCKSMVWIMCSDLLLI